MRHFLKSFKLLFRIMFDSILILLFLALILYFVLPRWVMSRPSVIRQAERKAPSFIKNMQLSLKEFFPQSLADIRARGLSVDLSEQAGKGQKKFLQIEDISLLLPPEAQLTLPRPFHKDKLFAAAFSIKGLSAFAEGIRVSDLSASGSLCLDPLFSEKGKDFFSYMFQAWFSAGRVSKDDYEIRNFSGFLSNAPGGVMAAKGRFQWKDSDFVFAAQKNGKDFFLHAQGKNIDLEKFISRNISATSLFQASISVSITESTITAFSALFTPEKAGVLSRFDYYSLLNMVPEGNRKTFRQVLDAFQKYPFDSGTILFEWKDNVFTMDFDFQGHLSRTQPHLSVPVHNLRSFAESAALNIFPVFSKELGSIIPYLKSTKGD